MVLPAVCLAGIEPDPSSFSPSRTTDNSSTGCFSPVVDTVVKSPLRTTKPSTKRTLVSSSSEESLKVLNENCNSL